MQKELKDWTIVEIKAGIYDRQVELNILTDELRKRASVVAPEVKIEKTNEENSKESGS